jgi:hypothetical protein
MVAGSYSLLSISYASLRGHVQVCKWACVDVGICLYVVGVRGGGEKASSLPPKVQGKVSARVDTGAVQRHG